jgi:molybdenum cofactor cytidylyltransferase
MTGIIILAAGSSSRLGTAKQNLTYQGLTLLQRAVKTALAVQEGPVLVIVGANSEAITPTIEHQLIHVFENDEWAEGMASSIRRGVSSLQYIEPKANAALLLLCDQPFMDTNLLIEMISKKSPKGIVACAYNNTIGAPVLFDEFYFPELLLLNGQEGAKKLLSKFSAAITAIPFPSGASDVDTIADYEALTKRNT